MSSKVELLEKRRDDLIRQAAEQRQSLSEAYGQLNRPLRMADTALSLVRVVQGNPWLVTVVTATIGAFGFRSLSFPGRLLSLWRGTHGAINLWRQYRSSTEGNSSAAE